MRRFAPVLLLLALAFSATPLAAQTDPTPIATPTPAPGGAAPAQTPAIPLPPAGIVPAQLVLDVTGNPIAPDVVFAEIRSALDREIRPTLRPGANITYGTVNPWPLQPLVPGARVAVNVTVTIGSDAASSPVTAVATITLTDVPAAPGAPAVLFLDDDPEYLLSEGLVFHGEVTPAKVARLYYYHSDIGLPRDLDVVLTAAAPARVQLTTAEAGPDLDVMAVGHTVSRDLLASLRDAAGAIVDVTPGKPVVVRHVLLLQGEVAAGALDMHVVSGAISVSVVASQAGASPLALLAGPRMPYDGHNRHGTFDLTAFGSFEASFAVGGPDVAIRYGERTATPPNLNPSDGGRDLGNYGVLHRITFRLDNPTDTARDVYLYQKPLGGPVRASFLVDGNFKELGCMRLSQPYWVATYRVPPQFKGTTTTLTIPDGGSFYPVEFGVTQTPPIPYVPPVGSPDGCSPLTPPVAATARR